MTVLAAVAGFAVALVLVLGWMVLTLRRDVAALTAQLSRAATVPEATACRSAGSRARAASRADRSPSSGPWCRSTPATTKPRPTPDIPSKMCRSSPLWPTKSTTST